MPAMLLTPTRRGLPSVSVPVLSTTSVSIFSISSSASAFLTRTPAWAPRPVPTMIDIGVASPRAQGQAMISTATALTSAKPIAGAGPKIDHAANVGDGHDHDGRHEPGRDRVHELLDRGARALCFRDHGDDLRQQGIAADAFGAHHEAARGVDRGPGHLVSGDLLRRQRLAGDHRFIDRAVALEHHAVDRDFLAGPYAQAIAGNNVFERDVLVAAVVAQPARALGRQIEQRADGAAGLGAGAQLEDLAEEDEGDDDRRRLEIERHLPVGIAERGGKDPRRQRGHQAVDIGDAGAERDQREHVEPAADDRSPAALKERPAAPQHRRRAEDQLHPDSRRGEIRESSAALLKCSAMAMASSGTESATPTQKRRVMSRNSGLTVSPAVGVIGSSAMPQIGQLPGSFRTICGCIGQVQRTSPGLQARRSAGRAAVR